MSEQEVKPEHKPTSCFTYEVKMIVQIFAKDKIEADAKLDAEGGFVSKRNVVFKDVVELYSGDLDLDEESTEKKED
jgi:hypothetical protein